MKVLVLALICGFALALPPQTPIIGVYTQWDASVEPTSEDEQRIHLTAEPNEDFKTYIAASYVKFLEMAGAQVVPIFSYSEPAVIQALLPKLNGVLFPGGGEPININNKWTSNANLILNYAINENKNNRTFPVWGTCLGMQLLSYLTSGFN